MNIQPTYPAMVATGGYGDGLGGGGLGLLALAMLGGRGGFGFGNDGFRRDGEGCVTPSNLTAGLAGVTDTIQNTNVLTGIGDLKGAVPLAEAQVQLALAGAQADITSQNMQQTIALQQQGFNGQLATLQGFAQNGDKIDAVSTQLAIGQGVTNTNIERLGWQLSATVKDDGEKTRALITANQIAELNRIAAERQDLINELQNEGRRRDDRHSIEINMTNNQNQQQLQFQAQQQQITNLLGCIHGLDQNIRATQQNVNFGVQAGVGQTSNATNNSVR